MALGDMSTMRLIVLLVAANGTSAVLVDDAPQHCSKLAQTRPRLDSPPT